jgi:CheY-like chemotaxis protein
MAAPILQEGAPDGDFRALAEMVEKCARRGADIIKQLLTFARGAPGSRVPVPVRHLMRDIQKILQETFPREIQSLLKVGTDLRLVLADASQLHQAVLNLCVNARDAMPDGGTLTLLADNVDLDEKTAALVPEARPGPYVRLAVVDTGTGISPQNLDRIFEPFFTTKELGKGTGLGLSTVMGIVRGHGGFVRVESREGKGTTFELYLPASVESGDKTEAKEEPAAPRGNDELILLVDDEPTVRESVRRILQRNGYKVITASNGREGMATFTTHRNDVRAVLTDMMMPTMNGPSLIRSLRAVAPELRIFGMTGLADPKPNHGIDDLHLEAMLHKPFAGSELLRALRSTFERRSAPEQADVPARLTATSAPATRG